MSSKEGTLLVGVERQDVEFFFHTTWAIRKELQYIPGTPTSTPRMSELQAEHSIYFSHTSPRRGSNDNGRKPSFKSFQVAAVMVIFDYQLN